MGESFALGASVLLGFFAIGFVVRCAINLMKDNEHF
jgi:hypothetical protein